MGAFFEYLEVIKKELIVFSTAILPLVELKGAIPVGIGMGLSAMTSFIVAYLGSILPVPILLLFLKPVMAFLKGTRLLAPFANWVERRTNKKVRGVRKYSLLGLFIFVAVPLPTTGIWTGSAIASFLDIRIMHAFPVIALGNLVAGLIIMFLSHQIF
ncbi:MAG TPA: small multi-drug export protein [Clostridia bacterium]|nr:small multi-drug export protein [Clostridia bacterium]